MREKNSPKNPILTYFLLVFILTLPFWLLDYMAGAWLAKAIPINLPLSALATFNPLIAAAILSYRQSGGQGVRALLGRTFDFRKIKNKLWIAASLLIMPAALVSSYAVMRLVGRPLPERVEIQWLAAPVFFVMFFIGATGEELGWTGFATDPLQERWGWVKASLLIGAIWAAWHIIGYMQGERSAEWIAWQCLFTVAMRVLMVWVYNGAGKSVFIVILYHTMANVSMYLFPNYGSHYDPMVTGALIGLAALAVVGWERVKNSTEKNGEGF